MHLPHPNLNAKLGPLPRKAWLGIGGAGGVLLYLHHRSVVNAAASAGDPTAAGSALDANGNYVNGTGVSGTGGTPMSGYDPYTSGYNGYGYDLLLGSGGVAAGSPAPAAVIPSAPAPVGQDGTDAGPVVAPVLAANVPAPGAAASSPQALTVNYFPTTQTPATTAHVPSKAQRATVHKAAAKAIHNHKNGRPVTQHRQAASKKTTGHQNTKSTDRAASHGKPKRPKVKPPKNAKPRRRLTGGVGY